METQDYGYPLGSVALAFLAGGLVGAGAALLLAPQSGEETRHMLKEYARDAQYKAWYKTQEAKEALEGVVEEGKQFINEKKAVLTASVEAGREALKKERMPQGV